jgi:fused signal recognition particle receptor
MNPDDDDQTAKPSKKPGFFRRLFGGRSAAPEDERLFEEAPAAEIAPIAPEPEPSVSARVDPDAESPAPPAPAIDAVDGDPEAFFAQAAEPESDHVAAARFEPAAEPEEPAPEPEQTRAGWWTRLKKGLARSSSSINQGIVDIFAKRKLDATTLDDLDDILIRADLGVATAARITEAVGKGRYDKAIDPEDVKAVLAEQVEATLAPIAKPLVIDAGTKPFTILMIGVNGSGKTTTIGKLAAKFARSGKTVMLAAGDTFRAAAVEQLRVWGARTGAAVVARDQGADAAGLAFDALKQAQQTGTDVLLIDTAGRLQNRAELMDELAKVIRVLRKVDPEAPHAVLLVLDATVGQNALSQVEIFLRVAGVTGLIMTKLDGTARGGILVAIAEKFGLPVHFIGVGEGVDDLEPFEARDFARAIAGLDDDATRH